MAAEEEQAKNELLEAEKQASSTAAAAEAGAPAGSAETDPFAETALAMQAEAQRALDKYKKMLLKIPSASTVSELSYLCLNSPELVPDALRPSIWKFLLTGNALSRLPLAWDGAFNLPCQAAIHAACESEPLLLSRSTSGAAAANKDELVSRLESIVTCFCASSALQYADGMATIAAPFALLGMNDTDAFTCVSSTLSTYLPFLAFNDPAVLEGICDLLRLLVNYYDPALGFLLQQRNVLPSCYAGQWITRLFASACASPAALTRVWDRYFLHNDPFLFIFLALALILDQKQVISALEAPQAVLLHMKAVKILSADHADKLVASALKYSSHCPVSFKKQLNAAMINSEHFKAWVLHYAQASLAMHVSALDISNEIAKGKEFFVLDCRPREAFEKGHLPTAFNMPATDMLDNPEEFEGNMNHMVLLQSPEGGPTMQFVICGVSGHGPNSPGSDDLNTLIIRMMKRGLRHVSAIHRGYESCHELHLAKKLELASHIAGQCPICSLTGDLSLDKATEALSTLATQGAKRLAAAKTGWLSGLNKIKASVSTAMANAAAPAPVSAAASAPAVAPVPAANQELPASSKSEPQQPQSSSSQAKEALQKSFAAMHSLLQPKEDKKQVPPAPVSASTGTFATPSPGAEGPVTVNEPQQQTKQAATVNSQKEASSTAAVQQQPAPSAVPAPSSSTLFTIGDDEDEDDEEAASGAPKQDEYSPLTQWTGIDNAVEFPCNSVGIDGKSAGQVELVVVLAPAHLYGLHKRADRAKLLWDRSLDQLDKILLQKHAANAVTFTFREGSEEKVWMQDPKPLISAVQERFSKLPLTVNDDKVAATEVPASVSVDAPPAAPNTTSESVSASTTTDTQ